MLPSDSMVQNISSPFHEFGRENINVNSNPLFWVGKL